MKLSRKLFVQTLATHKWIYETTDGRLGHKLLGIPTLLLRTTGRKSGVVRTSALLYGEDGGRLVVVPSNGGARIGPGWLANIKVNPEVEVQIGRKRQTAAASVVTREDPDFDGLWRMMDALNKGTYDKYQAATSRQIPVVVLTLSS